MRLQTRLLWVVLPFLTLAVVASLVGLSYFSQQSVLRQARQDGQVLASVLGQSIVVGQRVERGMEQLIGRDLTTSATILAHFVAVAEQCRLPAAAIIERLGAMVSPDNLAEIWITDGVGKAYLHTVPDVAFTFSPDVAKHPQAAMFWPLLSAHKPAVVIQDLQPREIDGRPFKYVGISGVDRPRIVQVGMDGQLLTQLRRSLGVQELLGQVVQEASIQRIWVVNTALQVHDFAEKSPAAGAETLAAGDQAILREVIRTGHALSRIDRHHITVAAPLPSVMPAYPGSTAVSARDAPTHAGGAILLHMATGLLDQLLWREVLFSTLIAGLAVGIAALLVIGFTRRLVTPLHRAVAVAERVAGGDLAVSFSAIGTDEVSQLLKALSQMVNYLNALIGQVQRSTIELVSTANSLSAMTRTQNQEVRNLGSTTTQIAAATQEISATAEELLNTMAGVTQVAERTTDLANAGQSSLVDIETTMRTLTDATRSIASRLGLINEKANTIGSVTTTITKIADQTNLLSLNAAIEAEKAGEYGLGFAVLAREIRRLADQTAVATLDIEQMVKEMQDSVSGGVMEMDQFSAQVNRSVADTHAISQRFGEIIQQVQALLPQFDTVHEGMRSQSAGAREIRDAMLTLTESIRVSIEALETTNAATQRLEATTTGLRQEIDHFRLR